MRKARQAAGMTLREFCARTGVNYTSASLVENGHRPPTEKLAQACDSMFPGWRGWFSEYYEDSKSWVPAGFRSWSEYEDRAKTIRAWSPGIVHGLLQTADYARALIDVEPDSTDGDRPRPAGQPDGPAAPRAAPRRCAPVVAHRR